MFDTRNVNCRQGEKIYYNTYTSIDSRLETQDIWTFLDHFFFFFEAVLTLYVRRDAARGGEAGINSNPSFEEVTLQI